MRSYLIFVLILNQLFFTSFSYAAEIQEIDPEQGLSSVEETPAPSTEERRSWCNCRNILLSGIALGLIISTAGAAMGPASPASQSSDNPAGSSSQTPERARPGFPGIVAISSEKKGQISLSWKPIYGQAEDEAGNYEIFYSQKPDFAYEESGIEKVSVFNDTKKVLEGLQEDAPYYFKIRAKLPSNTFLLPSHVAFNSTRVASINPIFKDNIVHHVLDASKISGFELDQKNRSILVNKLSEDHGIFPGHYFTLINADGTQIIGKIEELDDDQEKTKIFYSIARFDEIYKQIHRFEKVVAGDIADHQNLNRRLSASVGASRDISLDLDGITVSGDLGLLVNEESETKVNEKGVEYSDVLITLKSAFDFTTSYKPSVGATLLKELDLGYFPLSPIVGIDLDAFLSLEGKAEGTASVRTHGNCLYAFRVIDYDYQTTRVPTCQFHKPDINAGALINVNSQVGFRLGPEINIAGLAILEVDMVPLLKAELQIENTAPELVQKELFPPIRFVKSDVNAEINLRIKSDLLLDVAEDLGRWALLRLPKINLVEKCQLEEKNEEENDAMTVEAQIRQGKGWMLQPESLKWHVTDDLQWTTPTDDNKSIVLSKKALRSIEGGQWDVFLLAKASYGTTLGLYGQYSKSKDSSAISDNGLLGAWEWTLETPEIRGNCQNSEIIEPIIVSNRCFTEIYTDPIHLPAGSEPLVLRLHGDSGLGKREGELIVEVNDHPGIYARVDMQGELVTFSEDSAILKVSVDYYLNINFQGTPQTNQCYYTITIKGSRNGR